MELALGPRDRGLAETVRAGGDAAWSVRLRREPWASGTGDELRHPPEVLLGGERVPRMDEGTALVLTGFRAFRELSTSARSVPGMSLETPHQTRWITWVTWIAILAPLPYGVSRLLWAAGLPVGIDEWLLRDIHAPGWGSVYIAFLVLLSEGTAVVTHRYVHLRRQTVPASIPWLGGRPVGHRTVIGVLAMPIAILAWANATAVPVMLDGFTIPAGNAGLPGWSFWGQVATFWVWGVSLTVATFAYWRSTRTPRRSARPAMASA